MNVNLTQSDFVNMEQPKDLNLTQESELNWNFKKSLLLDKQQLEKEKNMWISIRSKLIYISEVNDQIFDRMEHFSYVLNFQDKFVQQIVL